LRDTPNLGSEVKDKISAEWDSFTKFIQSWFGNKNKKWMMMSLKT
jgi:hypothetical protein